MNLKNLWSLSKLFVELRCIMSWKLGLYLSESFAEISGTSPVHPEPVSWLWYLRSKSLADGLKDFFDKYGFGDGSELRISSFWPEMIIQKNLGSSPALLVSAGFEDWLHLRQPKKKLPPTLPPERFRSFFSSDLIFGITERTDAEGKVQIAPKEEDLEFLHQKFILSETKNIAVGFLHSSKNSANEKFVAEFFRARDYKVWTSFDYGGGLNEVARWWRAGLEAYVHNTLKEMTAPLLAFCQERGVKIVDADHDSLEGSFSIFDRIRKRYKNSGQDYLLWADFRSFTLLDLKTDQRVTETLWGPIAAATPRQRQMTLRPTSLIENQALSGNRDIFFDIGFDPGPMCFGRGIKPTFIDTLFALNYLDVPAGFKDFINLASQNKIVDSLAITMRVLLKNEPHWPEFITGWARTQLVTEIIEFTGGKNLAMVGPLATSLAKLFEDKEVGFKLTVDPQTEWFASMTTMEM